MIGLPYAQIVEKYLIQLIIVILAGMNQDMVAAAV
jgi:hypothetical protein